MKYIVRILFILLCCSLIVGFNEFKTISSATIPIVPVTRQDLFVEIKTIGELEAARSISISSSIKGDQGKIIDLIADGIYAQPGQILVKMDPTPFEDKIEKLQSQLKEEGSFLASLEQALEWEKVQAEHKQKSADYEIEAAKLELEKITYGDGPLEIARLKGVMQKSLTKYEELKSYSQDLLELESQGFLNAIEVKQAQKKLDEEQEAYEMARMQHDSYVQHVFPMQIKKAETNLKRAEINADETAKSSAYNIAKAMSLIEQAKQSLADISLQLEEAKKELKQTELVAPAQGMVVLREDYRSGQRRKPRVGDVVVKNQPLIDLPDLSSMIVKTRVREIDLFKMGIGKKATIEVDAYPQLAFEGTISSIGVLALSDMGRGCDEKYFDVRISLDQSDPCLRPGMTTRSNIHAQQVLHVLTIPLQSVFSENKQSYCYIALPNHEYEKKNIKLGISNEQWVEIKEGLNEGESVCLINPFFQ